MQTLTGTVLDKLDFELVKLRDLVYYEGPILSHFHDTKGNNYLMRWTDMDTVCNRWLLCLVSAAQLSSYLAGELALYDVITTTTHDVYFIDMDNNIEYRHITKMKPTEIPDNYLPGKNSFFDKKYTGVTP